MKKITACVVLACLLSGRVDTRAEGYQEGEPVLRSRLNTDGPARTGSYYREGCGHMSGDHAESPWLMMLVASASMVGFQIYRRWKEEAIRR